MSWLPWLLLLALVVAAVWCFAEIAGHVRWARRALLADGGAPRPQGWLVRKLRLEELFVAIERRAANEGELATINATNLAAAKTRKCAEIDARSGVLVTSGLEVASGKVISTSMAATQNLQDIALSITLNNATFPQNVSTLDGGVYSIADVADFVRIAGLLKAMKKAAMSTMLVDSSITTIPPEPMIVPRLLRLS